MSEFLVGEDGVIGEKVKPERKARNGRQTRRKGVGDEGGGKVARRAARDVTVQNVPL